MNNYNVCNFKDTIQFITKTFELCNGKINQTKSPKEIKLIFHGNKIAYISYDGIFYFNISSVLMLNNITKTRILDVIVHELSHLDQIIDYHKYNNDTSYREFIEKSNIDRTYNFIISNKDILERELDFTISMKYMNMIKNFYKKNKGE